MTQLPGSRSFDELRFVVVGAYVADCLVRTARLPAWGFEHEARSIHTMAGGKALNQAVALARLGAQVTAVGVVGSDGVGRDVLAALGRERVDVGYVESREGVATSICLCFIGDGGESAILWHVDDDAAVSPETVRAAGPAIEQADAVLVTFETPVPTIREAINSASSHGARVFVAPAPALAEPSDADSLPWDRVDVLVPNELEARALLGRDKRPADQLADALSQRLAVATVAVTLGASGCVVHSDGASGRYPAHKVDAVDTTGAGDAFTAAFAASLTAGATQTDAVDAGQMAAARAVQHWGGHDSVLTPASPG